MPLNRDFIGREYPFSGTFEVGREHIRQFATAIGETSPVCTDVDAAKAAGHPDVVAPPTFLTTLNFRFATEGPVVDPELGLNYALVVHGEQEFQLHRPVRAGDVLSVVSRVTDIRDAGRNEIMVVEGEVTDATGERVATVRSSIVSRGTAAGEVAPA